jgi:tRNA(fMet)-specific endonuclease VapC
MIRAKSFISLSGLVNPGNLPVYVSIVSEAELRSLAIRKKWGIKRLYLLNSFLDTVNIVDVNDLSVNIYAEIDTYSQRLNPKFAEYPFNTPRNMGKNDLWIASLSAFLNLKLITTDADFDHLHNTFFEVKKMRAADFLPFF